jgi:uncharacterized membrane protein
MKIQSAPKNVAAIAFAVVALMWVLHSLTKNFAVNPDFSKLIAAKTAFNADRPLWLFMLRAHIVLAVISLLTGPVGAIRKLRIKSIAWHRWNGRMYVISILLNVIPGLYVSLFAAGGWTIAGFLVLNTLWLAATALGYIHIRRKRITSHTRWITRSFFLAYANLIIHLLLPLGQYGLRLSYEASYAIAVWGSIVVNLELAETALRRKWIA